MAWRRPGDKPLFEPMMVSLLTHICITRPQWILNYSPLYLIFNAPANAAYVHGARVSALPGSPEKHGRWPRCRAITGHPGPMSSLDGRPRITGRCLTRQVREDLMISSDLRKCVQNDLTLLVSLSCVLLCVLSSMWIIIIISVSMAVITIIIDLALFVFCVLPLSLSLLSLSLIYVI